MTIVIVVYMMANVAYLGVLSPSQMLLSPAVAVVSNRTETLFPYICAHS